jgi:hypothetical protein
VKGTASHPASQSELPEVGAMMTNDVPHEPGTDGAAEAESQLDCNRLDVDVVTLEAFLAALREYNPSNDRVVNFQRTPPTLTE